MFTIELVDETSQLEVRSASSGTLDAASLEAGIAFRASSSCSRACLVCQTRGGNWSYSGVSATKQLSCTRLGEEAPTRDSDNGTQCGPLPELALVNEPLKDFNSLGPANAVWAFARVGHASSLFFDANEEVM